MNKNPALNMYDNDTVKWENEGKLFCLHVQRDEMPMDPRADMDNVTVMACWHRNYRLGDKIEDDEPEDFWRRLVQENVPESEVYAMAEAGNLKGIRIEKNKEDPELVDVYETYYWQKTAGRSDPKECLEYEGLDKNTVTYYLLDDLTINQCMTLMEPYAEWMPLWLYDHSGITMSCGARVGQYADCWDSGCVGWIIVLKKTVMEEVGTEYVLDENGERIRLEHKHEGHPSTWSYKTRPLTDDTWRSRAVKIMQTDVEIYDLYLTGEVYGYTIHEWNDDDESWNEGDSYPGFLGSDIVENGICGEVGCGLRDAILENRYETGSAELHTISYYTF